MKRLKKSFLILSALVIGASSYFSTPAEAETLRLVRKYSNPARIEQKYHLYPTDYCHIIPDDLSSIDDVFESDSDEKTESFLDRLNLEFVIGAYHSPIGIGPDHDDWDYFEAGIRFGMDITKNFEGLLELSYAKTITGWDGHVSGFLVWLRYNFETDWKLKPYFQGGAGIVNNNIFKHRDQKVITQRKEYYLKWFFGLSYNLTESSKVGVEAGYAHLSNNDEQKENDGANPLVIGIVYSIDFDFFK